MADELMCLFCFSTFREGQNHYRCMSGCREEDDFRYRKAHDPAAREDVGQVKMGHVFTSRSSNPRCDVCGDPSRTRLCPECHEDLPENLGEGVIIAVVGSRGAGKTVYLASLLEQLRGEPSELLDFSVLPIGDETRSQFIKRTAYGALGQGQMPEGTQAGETVKRYRPLQFRLNVRNRRWPVILNFFDVAGEDLGSAERMRKYLKHLYTASAIIVLLDPHQIGGLKDQVERNLPAHAMPLPTPHDEAQPRNLIARLIEELTANRGPRGRHEKIKIPTAFTMTKIDTLRPIMSAGSALFKPVDDTGKDSRYTAAARKRYALNLTTVGMVSEEVRTDLLGRFIDVNWVKAVEQHFSTYSYFGVSSLGGHPIQQAMGGFGVESIVPLRVEDPLLWILYEFVTT